MMQDPCQEPPMSSKAQNQDLDEMDVLCTFNIRMESQNLFHGYFKDQWPYQNHDQDAKPQPGTDRVIQMSKSYLRGYGCSLHPQNQDRAIIWNIGISKTSDLIQIMIMMPNLSQKPPASPKAQKQDLEDIDVLCFFKIRIENYYFEERYIKDLWPYPNQDHDVKFQWETSSFLQTPESLFRGHGCFLHLQYHNRAKIWNIGILKTRYHIQIKIKITNPSQESSVSSTPELVLTGHGYSLNLWNQNKEKKFLALSIRLSPKMFGVFAFLSLVFSF